jgi:pimeloyl-ACP methyl ester carboxylesterase
MHQTISWSAFSTGLVVFAGLASEMITEHTQWTDFATPLGVAHLLILGMSFGAMVGGALAVQLPRSGSHGDRVNDPKPEPPKENK